MFLETKREGEGTTKADPLTLPALIAWLEKMPAQNRYSWSNCSGGCLVGQYGKVHGIDRLDAEQAKIAKLFKHEYNGGDGYYNGGDGYYNGGDGYYRVCATEPHTYGAALERARKLLKVT
jgi:hypothetical protein